MKYSIFIAMLLMVPNLHAMTVITSFVLPEPLRSPSRENVFYFCVDPQLRVAFFTRTTLQQRLYPNAMAAAKRTLEVGDNAPNSTVGNGASKRAKTSGRYVCRNQTCPESYGHAADRAKHERDSHPELFKIRCPQCDKGFRTTRGRDEHRKSAMWGDSKVCKPQESAQLLAVSQ